MFMYLKTYRMLRAHLISMIFIKCRESHSEETCVLYMCIYFYPQDCLKCSQYAKQQDPKFRETLDYSVERCVFNFTLFSLYSLPLLV